MSQRVSNPNRRVPHRSPKKNPTPPDSVLREAWGRDLPLKRTAQDLGIPHVRLRKNWVRLFGLDVYKARGKRLQAESAARVCRENAKTRTYRTVQVPCSKCAVSQDLRANQAAHLDRSKFVCDDCRYDRACPVCQKRVSGAVGLSAHLSRSKDEAHRAYQDQQRASKWEGKTEPRDFVTCRECGFRGETLANHIQKHGLTAATYREKYGESTPIRSDACRENRSAAIKKALSIQDRTGTKETTCPDCGCPHQVNKHYGPRHDHRCGECRAWAEALRWENLREPFDYVECVECGYRAENLTSHITNAHPTYREDYPEVVIVALNSPIRDKSELRGRVLSEETRRRMSVNAGRWNKGLTKDTHPSLQAISEKMVGRVPWNRGLTRETDPRVQAAAAKIRLYVGENRPWDNGLRIDLSSEDMAPVLDSKGRVDWKKVSDHGLPGTAVRRYMDEHDLKVSPDNRRAASDAQIIRLDKEVFEPFKLKNGKVDRRRAAEGIGHGVGVITREALRHGIEIAHRRVAQPKCLQAISKALGDSTFTEEWKDWRFVSLKGFRYRYDGFFPAHNLVVEFQGYQHYTWPNRYHKSYSQFLAGRQRDRLKRGLVEAVPDLVFLEVREDEPYDDVSYLQGRLVQLGVSPCLRET